MEDDTDAALAAWARASKYKVKADKQVTYRKVKKAEHATLKQSIEDLERVKVTTLERRAARLTGILPWKDVAKALMDDRKLTEAQQKILLTELRRQRGVVWELYQWVSSQVVLQSPLDGACLTWRNVSLLANPESRKLGKEWITKQMYHNTNKTFQKHGFPSLDSPEGMDLNARFDFDEGGYTLVSRMQITAPRSFEDYITYFRAVRLTVEGAITHYTPGLPVLVNEVEGSTRQYAAVTEADVLVNVLHGEFETADEYTIVMQHIQVDDSCQNTQHKRQRSRTDWTQMRRLPDGGVRIRAIMVVSQLFTIENGPLSLEEDAKEWGIDLDQCPDHLKEARYPRLWQESLARQMAARSQKYANKQSEKSD